MSNMHGTKCKELNALLMGCCSFDALLNLLKKNKANEIITWYPLF